MHFMTFAELWIKHLSEVVSLPWFVLIGSFVEEVVSPIPSLLVMGTAGTLALAQGRTILFLIGLSFVGNIGKTAGAWVYYVIGDVLEDLAVPKYGKYFGVTHGQIEHIGQKFTGTWKDAAILFLLRLIPFFPTTPVSIMCGIIKMRLPEYLILTFFGNFIKDFLYLLIGYAGVAVIGRLWRDIDDIRFFVHLGIVALMAFCLFLLWNHRHKGVWMWEGICRWWHSRRGQ